MKKLFKEGRFTGKGILEFLDKKGFYIVLILCIAIVGATAVFVATYNVTSSNEDSEMENIIAEDFGEDAVDETGEVPVGNSTEPAVDIVEDEEVAIGTSLSSSEEEAIMVSEPAESHEEVTGGQDLEEVAAEASKPAENKQKDTAPSKDKETVPNKESQSEKKTTEEEFQLIMPVSGNVTFDYAMDKLVYSRTLEDWRTHSGIDLAAERGTNIKAAADGFISEVKNDPRFGATIIIDHQNGLKTVYSNLATTDTVTTNQKIKQGDIIGSVGNTALFESAEQPHLHFEVLKEGNPSDPREYLDIK